MKVLIVSHNPISTFNNMGKTFLNMFGSFSKEELCQLYVHPTVSDVDVCSSSFRITDKQALKSLVGKHPGGEVKSQEIARCIQQRMDGTQPPPPKRGSSSATAKILRDIVWKLSRWYSRELRAWLNREQPQIIFIAPGYAKFIYDMALEISKEYALPIVTYICDDYYFVKTPRGVGNIYHLARLKKKTEQLMAHTERLVVISEELRECYQTHFNVPSDVLMTGAGVSPKGRTSLSKDMRNICYFGNLGEGRAASLADIARALDRINKTQNTSFILRIFSPAPDNDTRRLFEGIPCVELCGFVSGQAYEEAFSSSDMLIHTESFDEAFKDRVKYSVSTKIADSLASGIPLLAYGPAQLSSMRHLIRHQCAFVATSPNELEDVLQSALFDERNIDAVRDRALKTAANFHDKATNSKQLRTLFQEIVGDGI